MTPAATPAARLLLLAAKPLSANADKIGIGLAWLFTTATALIERHIWSPAEAIWFLLLAQNTAMFLELFWHHRHQRLTWRLTRSRLLRVIGGFFGTVLTLFIATGIARYSTVFQSIYLPQALIALVFSVVLTNTAKQASRLGIISPLLAKFLENQSKYVQNQLSKNEAATPATNILTDSRPPVPDPDQPDSLNPAPLQAHPDTHPT